ncbi:Crp/Fnr family transcriptional regulator [Frigoriflavimonas asaccharolytica]|uniref:CRP-like cAMP-binding protein n=1 Tax=Frigoriflavimonas asaccharolytica TaxID=2735899 RepID=A0A8J8KCQ4_9FLAO|nr:Crp/Fnr family transcriptional regulator [Frigoriflavimonas asaccharolytica]NRS93904.1 CRP-like cAMP-binding protein [Frigoriflavimonas asaccharolytica]
MKFEQLLFLLRKYDAISKDEEMNIKKYFVSQNINKKEILINQNKPCNKLYFVNSGLLRAYYVNDKANEITRMFAWENRFLTNISSFKNFSDNIETIECVEKAEILYISRENFDKLMLTSRNLKSIYGDVLEEYNALHIKRFHHLNSTNIEEKIKHLKNDFPYIINKVNDSLLASFLGISRETFVRHKKIL